MTVGYYKLVGNPIIAAFLDEVSLVENIIRASSVCYAVVKLLNIPPFPPPPINK